MLKKSTLLTVSIFLVLFIGLSDYGYGCHRGVQHGPHTCPEPDPPPPSGGGDAEYSVDITGAVFGHSHFDWSGGQGGKSISGANIDIGRLTDLSFFTLSATSPDMTAGGPFSGTLGVNCFGMGDPLTVPEADFFPQVILKQGRGGRAESSFWFKGRTNDGIIDVLYVLIGFGLFFDGTSDPIWPPLLVTETTDMIITNWELRVENEGSVVKNISCIGEGEFADFDNGDEPAMIIAVTRTH